MSAENPQSFLIVEVLPKASQRTVICAALDSAYAGAAPIAAVETISAAILKRTWRVIVCSLEQIQGIGACREVPKVSSDIIPALCRAEHGSAGIEGGSRNTRVQLIAGLAFMFPGRTGRQPPAGATAAIPAPSCSGSRSRRRSYRQAPGW